MKIENHKYLTEQIITYIGNKRLLIEEIEKEIIEIKKELKQDKVICLDLFSGSGIVARMMKQHSSLIIANDLEKYSFLINNCFLSNYSDFDETEYVNLMKEVIEKCNKKPVIGIITENYAPKNENKITKDDRVFYTRKNSIFIDSFRTYIDEVKEPYKSFMLTQLITEASIHANTSGVFKGFYKNSDTGIGMYGGKGQNALKRIKGSIDIKIPVFSNFDSDYKVYKCDAVELSKTINADITYIDPPYNQHPYGSNYFMLNTIIENEIDSELSKVSGIPRNWNHSAFNYKSTALSSFEEIISNIKSKYIIISYNNEGFITFEEMNSMLSKYGFVKNRQIKYNTFKGSRNLNKRNIYTNEYIFVLRKD